MRSFIPLRTGDVIEINLKYFVARSGTNLYLRFLFVPDIEFHNGFLSVLNVN